MSLRCTPTELLTRWARSLALGLALMVAGLAQAQSIESVLQPGPVIQGHAKTENDCSACHQRFDRNADAVAGTAEASFRDR